MARMKNHQIEWNEAVQPEPVLGSLVHQLSIRGVDRAEPAASATAERLEI